MSTQQSLTLTFNEISSADLALVGGKGANLGEMTYIGLPVPEGFCLTTNAYDKFITQIRDTDKIYSLLNSIDTDDLDAVREVGKIVRDAMMDGEIPDSVKTAVKITLDELGTEAAYAIRSSATAEDLPEASFAGQQDTYLNVIGFEEIIVAVQKCWASLFTDRAILYRIKNNFDHREVKISVVVQRMVRADVSGTLFTADPISGHRGKLLIESSIGLGEALVSGQVSPDTFLVDKEKNKILKREISEKKIAILPTKHGGTEKVTLEGDQARQSSLDDDSILELTALSKRLESHYDFPQDIEWAKKGDQLYILQTRPITSLYPIDGLKSPDDSLRIYFSMGHQQSMTRPMTPLSLSSIQTMVPMGHDEGKFFNNIIRISGGRLFADITKPLRHPIMKRVVLKVIGQMDALGPKAVKQVMDQEEFQQIKRPHTSMRKIGFVMKMVGRGMNSMWLKDLNRFIEQTNEKIEQLESQLKEKFDNLSDPLVRLEAVAHLLPNIFSFFLHWIPEAGAGIGSTRILENIAKIWLSDEEVDDLTKGIQGNVVNEMNMAIGDLADKARSIDKLVEAFNDLEGDAHDWLEKIEDIEGADSFLVAWDDFIQTYGMRAPNEIDIASPRWYEDPFPVLRVIKEYLSQEKGSHRKTQKKLIEQRREAYKKLIAKASQGLFGNLRARLIQRLYYTMTKVGGLREHHKFTAIKLLAIVKEVLKDTAAQLIDTGKLDNVDDIWYLKWPELFDIWDDDETNWREIISKRRHELSRYQKINPPMVITSDGEVPDVEYDIEDAPEGALLGNPVSSGIVEGPVHIINDPNTESLAPGEILVAEFTDPGWTPLFINAKALILEIGGALTHGAVVAREYGIPAVVGVKKAREKLQTGQHVRIDGNKGVIEIL